MYTLQTTKSLGKDDKGRAGVQAKPMTQWIRHATKYGQLRQHYQTRPTHKSKIKKITYQKSKKPKP